MSDNFETFEGTDSFEVDFFYPLRTVTPDRQTKTWIDVGLSDVRASDGIRIRYDFKRDGYAIYQQKQWMFETYSLEQLDSDGKDIWEEVAFVESWSCGEEVPEDDPRVLKQHYMRVD